MGAIYFNSDVSHSTKITTKSSKSINLYTNFTDDSIIGNQRVFDNAKVISKWEEELCSHSSILYAEDKGEFYLFYNPNKVSSKETITDSQTSMTYFNLCNLNKIEKIDIAVKGQIVGDFKHASAPNAHSPYEPFKFDIDVDNFRIIYTAINENDSKGKRQVWQKFTKTTKQLESVISPCYLKYNSTTVEFTNRNVLAMHNTLFGTSMSSNSWDNSIPQTITKYVQYNGWYYCWFSISETSTTDNKISAYILRTQDGVTYEYVARPNIGNSTYPEGCIELINDTIYIVLRGMTNYNIFSYNITNDTFSSLVTIGDSDSKLGRPFIQNYKGKLVLIVNSLSANIKINDYDSWRSGLGIYQINPSNLTFKLIRKVSNKYGVHYYTLREDNVGNWWLSFSEDRRQLSTYPNNNNRSNISILKFEDIF